MRRRELLALTFLSVALWLVLNSISSAIADSLPGREAQRRWMFAALGLGDASVIGLDRTSQRSFRPGCSIYLVTFFGLTGSMLWVSGARARRRDHELWRERSSWSSEAVSRVIGNVTRAASNGDEVLASAIDEARRAVRPYLVEPYAWVFDRSLERLAPPAGAAATIPPPAWPAKRRWPRLVSEAILVLAATMVGIGGTTGVGVATFDELPDLGMPLGPSAVYEGIAVWMIAAVAWTFVALGLRRLDRQVVRAEEDLVAERRKALMQLAKQLSSVWSGLTAAASSGSPAQRVVSAFAMALLEALHPGDRQSLLPLCEQLELRGAGVAGAGARQASAARDAWSVGTEISSLICLHAAVLVGAALCYLTGLWVHIPLGWFRAPTTRDEEIYSSPLGAAIVGVPFLLAISFLIGLAWVLRRSAAQPWSRRHPSHTSRTPSCPTTPGP